MTMIKLGYTPQNKYKWKVLQNSFEEKEYNKKKVIKFNILLWGMLKVIVDMKAKGWDNIVLIDGRRRSGKSTLAMTIAYLLNPNISIDNYVSGLEESPRKIDKAKDEDVLIFDEGSLIAGSKDAMTKQSKQLHKIIDVIGQKRLTLLFCMPSFLSMSKNLVLDHSMFLIKVGVSKKTLERGRFKVYKNEKMKRLYLESKKDPKQRRRIAKSFNGRFEDFHLPFEEEYFKLKTRSMQEAINPESVKSEKPLTELEVRNKYMMSFKDNCPECSNLTIARGFGVSKVTFYHVKRGNKGEISKEVGGKG